MYRLCLINMPFAALTMPSLAITQLKSVVQSNFPGQVSVDLCYINHDFAQLIGVDLYNFIASSVESHTMGIGDWLFRQVAFPESEDNSESYFQRYFRRTDAQTQKQKQIVREIRQGLDEFLNQVIKQYELDSADMIGFTSMFAQNGASFALARRLKECNPNVVTMMGGANCEAPMGQEIVKNVKQIDFVFSGPALISFCAFLRYRLNQEFDKCHTIKGVFSKRNSGLATLNCKGEIGEELPIDVEIELDYESYLQVIRKHFPNKNISLALLFETSRGCWWGEKSHCTFCGLNGISMNYRAMSPEKAIAQFNHLFKYSDVCKCFECVDNILPKNFIKDVFPYIDTPPDACIFYEVKADLSEADLQILSKARVTMIQPGIESLATSTLKLMKKGTNAFINLALLKNCVIYNISPAWNLLIGFPGEGEEVYQKYMVDIPLLAHLPPPDGVYPVRFDRYSPYFVQAEHYELDLRPLDYYRLTYPFSEESITNLAYYFTDINITAKYSLDMARWVSKLRERVESWVSRWRAVDPARRPQLYLKKKGEIPSVYDSRFDKPVEHQISKCTFQILEFLNKPRRITDITANLDINHSIAESEILLLKEKNLIFQEGDRYMSVILPGAPLT